MASILLIAVLVSALIFEFINGFHDTANAIATTVYTKALPLRTAIIMSAIMNFIGALMSEKVAMTIASGLVDIQLQLYVIFAALMGAIVWDLFTWWFSIPSSSSHALIGSHSLGGCPRESCYSSVYFASYWYGPGLLYYEAGI